MATCRDRLNMTLVVWRGRSCLPFLRLSPVALALPIPLIDHAGRCPSLPLLGCLFFSALFSIVSPFNFVDFAADVLSISLWGLSDTSTS